MREILKMPETSADLGRAITRLGLEDKFLQNGQLQEYPLAQRGELASQIIAEKLLLGRWPTVVKMIWGGFGKADVLYDGDKNQLKQQILESAQRAPMVSSDALKILSEKGEHEFIFNLMTGMPNLSYNDFVSFFEFMPRGYFDSPENLQRRIAYHQTAAKKAMDEKGYSAAFSHFKCMGDALSIDNIFETLLNKKQGKKNRDFVHLLETIALDNWEKRETRLKQLLSAFASREIEMDATHAYELFEQNRVQLSDEERRAFYDRVAQEVRRYDLETRHSFSFHAHRRGIGDKELILLWARKHAQSDPTVAYWIFQEQEYDGEELRTAVIEGLKGERKDRLFVSQVKPEYLKMVYDEMPFELQVQISQQLEDKRELEKLSRLAASKGDFRTAYRLGESAGRSFEGNYMYGLRTALIQAEIKDNIGQKYGRPSFYFLDKQDKQGQTDAFNALMQHGEDSRFLESAFEIALSQGDQNMLERVRPKMVEVDLGWALNTFRGGGYGSDRERKMVDPAGFEYALGILAEREGVGKDQLRPLVEKYGAGSNL